ncbi:hypothetical protein M3Y96_00554500 [Aphelenchoides besseyi]|nr:hypothetical protein M3Y96_00554500 [Aphelenchoides besseyi]
MFKGLRWDCILAGVLGSIVTIWIFQFVNTRSESFDRIKAPLRFDNETFFNLTQFTMEEDDFDHSNTQTEKYQQIAERVQCSTEGFENENITSQNSDSLPLITWRYDNQRELCEKAQSCLPKFPKSTVFSALFTAKSLKLGFCKVHKSASVVVQSIACLLDDPIKFLNRGKDLIAEAFDRNYCTNKGPNSFFTIQEAIEKLGLATNKDWKLGFVIRDPLDRFLSAFAHMCILGREAGCIHFCYDCGANMTCFLERAYEHLNRMSSDGEGKADQLTIHLKPQTWFCELEKHMRNFTFIRYHSDSEKFYKEELEVFLRSQNASSDALQFIGRSITTVRTQHSTTNFELKPFLKQRILESPYLLKLFLRIYYHDYQMFNFTLPMIAKNKNV